MHLRQIRTRNKICLFHGVKLESQREWYASVPFERSTELWVEADMPEGVMEEGRVGFCLAEDAAGVVLGDG